MKNFLKSESCEKFSKSESCEKFSKSESCEKFSKSESCEKFSKCRFLVINKIFEFKNLSLFFICIPNKENR